MSEAEKKADLTKKEKRRFTLQLQSINAVTHDIDNEKVSDAVANKLKVILETAVTALKELKKEV